MPDSIEQRFAVGDTVADISNGNRVLSEVEEVLEDDTYRVRTVETPLSLGTAELEHLAADLLAIRQEMTAGGIDWNPLRTVAGIDLEPVDPDDLSDFH